MKNLFIGNKIIRLNSIESTNNYTNELIRQSVIPEGLVVIAEEQSAGKGQRGNAWHTERGKNLTFSLLLRPKFLALKHQFQLTKCISLAIIHFLEQCNCKKMSIKWPNDIYVGDKKIAGILIENVIKGNLMDSTVVGIGININQIHFDEKHGNATSLKEITGINFNLEDALQLLLNSLEKYYLLLKSGSDKIDSAYLNTLYRLQENHCYLHNDNEIQGKITGVSEEGYLLFTAINGEKMKFSLKEIQFL